MPNRRHLLWVDDEIELLRSHILYLGERDYDVTQAANGPDALELAEDQQFDLALIDEMMPVMDGLEVLRRLKDLQPDLPVVMVTKNEAEELMEQAIGSQIDGYLTKPVNPSQILSVLKSILEKRSIAATQLSQRWSREFGELSRRIGDDLDADEWLDLHAKMCWWEIEIDRWGEAELKTMLQELRLEANRLFARWIEERYAEWVYGDVDNRPALSMDFADRWLLPLIAEKRPLLFLVLDCLRYDQWLALENLLADQFDIKRDGYFSILPTATPYSRNALFSGMLPADIERGYPDLWARGDEDEASSNRYERQFLIELLKRRGMDLKPEPKYVKVLDAEETSEFERRVNEYLNLPLSAMVYNFVDILIHTRQSVDVLKEMLPDESAFRSITGAWFKHSSLFRILKAYGDAGGVVLITTDHGAIRVRRGSKVVGDRETSTSIRYKHGRNLQYNNKHAVRVKDPAVWGLPRRGFNTEYIIAREDYYFVYPTNYHKYLDLYADSFQHGGISLEEMALPVATLRAK